MSDVLSEAPAVQGSPDHGAGDDSALAFGLHVRTSPPLSWLATLAALAAMLINQLLLPALNDSTRRPLMHQLDRWGVFSTNLAAVSSLIALGFGLLAFVRYSTVMTLRQRLLVGGFGGFVFLPTIALAVLFERQRTTAQIVLFALGAAQVLAAIISTSAARAARGRYTRVIAILAATMAVCVLSAQVLQLVSQVRLVDWQLTAQQAAQGIGEACYLLLLAGMTPMLMPYRNDARSRVARLCGFFVLPIALGSMYMAERALQSDYTVLLYHAQRVTLFIDIWPRLYAVPIGLALSASVAALCATDAVARQAAAAVLLLLASGYAPHAPGRLLTGTLAIVLLARAIISPAENPAPAKSTKPASLRAPAG
jgi:hypothetical protein